MLYIHFVQGTLKYLNRNGNDFNNTRCVSVSTRGLRLIFAASGVFVVVKTVVSGQSIR